MEKGKTIMSEQSEAEEKSLQDAADNIAENWDSVMILASRKEGKGTYHLYACSGNWFACLGHMQHVLNYEKAKEDSKAAKEVADEAKKDNNDSNEEGD